MKKRIFSALLALVLCLGLLPTAAFAAETNLPDWYFLFAIFKNMDADVKDGKGDVTHQTYTMPQDEIDGIRADAQAFEDYMNSLGIMRAHVDAVVIDAPVTELTHPDSASSRISVEQAAPLLETKVDLDRYDYVSCIMNLNVWTGWAGLTGATFENGTGMSEINFHSGENYQKSVQKLANRNVWRLQLYVHEFLHFMERMNRKWGAEFTLHRGGKTHYTDEDDWETYYTDALLNRVEDKELFPEGGTGVYPAVWQYPPHALRTTTELTVPSGVTSIGAWAFAGNKTLTRVYIPYSVTSIGGASFQQCSSLTSISLPASLASVEQFAFAVCSNLSDIYYSGSEAQWKKINISSTSNSALTRANIHYNSLMADVKTTDWYAKPVAWALEKGIAAGTGEGKFSPDATCTQGQILTFLWRANGEPAPSGKVSGTQYYASAVQWAKEQGLTSGALSPDGPCTRADVVTYLWKLAGSPAAGNADFSDVSGGAPYAQAVAWAVGQKITSGTGNGRFSPDAACTRGQIVTFLYSAFAK